MQIASRTFNPDLLSRTPPGSPSVATIKPQKVCYNHQVENTKVCAVVSFSWSEPKIFLISIDQTY